MAIKETIVKVTMITPTEIPAIAPVDNPEFSWLPTELFMIVLSVGLSDSLAIDEEVATDSLAIDEEVATDSLAIDEEVAPDSFAIDKDVATDCGVDGVGASRNICCCCWLLHAAGIKSVGGQTPSLQGLLRQHPRKGGSVSLQVYQLLLLALLRQSFGKIKPYISGLNDAG